MGGWSELDAVYPPGMLTPGAVLVTALAHLHGATSLYDENGALARFVPDARRGLALDRDLLDRIEQYLARVRSMISSVKRVSGSTISNCAAWRSICSTPCSPPVNAPKRIRATAR